jgi:hypothetical protein
VFDDLAADISSELSGIFGKEGCKFFTSRLLPENTEEMLTGGDFSSADGWTLGAGWSIGSGEAYALSPAAGEPLSRAIALTSGEIYVVSIKLPELYDGSVGVQLDGDTVLASLAETGTHAASITAPSAYSAVSVVPTGDFQGNIDDLSVLRHFPLDVQAIIRRDVELVDDYQQVAARTNTIRLAHKDIVIVPQRGDTLTQGSTVFTFGKLISNDGYSYVFEATA